ncbi:MAG: phenylalanyl-tRNA synthetase subunit alpha chain [Chlorobi bacterium]|nr:phenylalanyl-tRNA synthetase subunit alpha chain [Chlorobiota bacterium]
MHNYTAEHITTTIVVGLTFISAFAAMFFAWYFYIKAKQKERMALIEKASEGIDAAKLFAKPKRLFRFPWLKLGILIFFFTLGLSVGVILYNLKLSHSDFIPILGFMFGGLGMIAAHFAGKKEDTNND